MSFIRQILVLGESEQDTYMKTIVFSVDYLQYLN